MAGAGSARDRAAPRKPTLANRTSGLLVEGTAGVASCQASATPAVPFFWPPRSCVRGKPSRGVRAALLRSQRGVAGTHEPLSSPRGANGEERSVFPGWPCPRTYLVFATDLAHLDRSAVASSPHTARSGKETSGFAQEPRAAKNSPVSLALPFSCAILA